MMTRGPQQILNRRPPYSRLSKIISPTSLAASEKRCYGNDAAIKALLNILRVDVNIIDNLHFDAALAQISTDMHGIHRLL
jgi:hypothetical protein